MKPPETADAGQGLTLDQRRSFQKLPLAERERQMAEQADRMAPHYEATDAVREREEWQGGDVVEPS